MIPKPSNGSDLEEQVDKLFDTGKDGSLTVLLLSINPRETQMYLCKKTQTKKIHGPIVCNSRKLEIYFKRPSIRD